jgi:hypothetical protein
MLHAENMAPLEMTLVFCVRPRPASAFSLYPLAFPAVPPVSGHGNVNAEVGLEMKGRKLLKEKITRFAGEGPAIPSDERRRLVRNLLRKGWYRSRGQTVEDVKFNELVTYGQATTSSSLDCSLDARFSATKRSLGHHQLDGGGHAANAQLFHSPPRSGHLRVQGRPVLQAQDAVMDVRHSYPPRARP